MKDIYINDNLFLKSMFKRDNVNLLNKNGNHFFAEIRRLKAGESEIITKLRTETANLNKIMAFYYKDFNGSPICNNCNNNRDETVNHYIMFCDGYIEQRKKLRNNLNKIEFFKNEQNWTTKNLLFPHSWQIHPKSDDKQYKMKTKQLLKQRLKIINEICNFVIETKRFDNKWGI